MCPSCGWDLCLVSIYNESWVGDVRFRIVCDESMIEMRSDAGIEVLDY
jgi:hypothetical protein